MPHLPRANGAPRAVGAAEFAHLRKDFPLRDNLWTGRRCFIIGGGPSLKEFDFSRIKGELIIGINCAFEFCDPTIIFSIDQRFYEDLAVHRAYRTKKNGKPRLCYDKQPLTERFINYMHGLKLWLDKNPSRFGHDVYVLQSLIGSQWSAMLKDGIGAGTNSGYAAINLATILNAATIYLVGFDMHGANGKQTWGHDGHPNVQGEHVYDMFRDSITYAAERYIDPSRNQIVNLCETSALKCFEFGAQKDIKHIIRPIVIAYYTEGTPYAEEAKQLERTLQPLGLEHDIVGVPNLGSWSANTSYKSRFILDMLAKYPKRALLYVDVDARFNAYPALFDNFKASFAAHYRDGRELLSGTVYVSGDAASQAIVQQWDLTNRSYPTRWDQQNLQQVLANMHVLFNALPPEYCAIFDAHMCNAPIIEHFQASRRYRHQIGAI